MSRLLSLPALALSMVFASQALAQQPPTTRVRGTLESLEGATMRVKSRDGTDMTFKVADPIRVTAISKMALADIKSGSYIGVASVPGPDGSNQAVSLNIFPETARGLGDGSRPYDLRPNSSMTNGAVADMVTANDGQTLTLKYKDGEKKVVVTPQTQISTFSPGDKAELKAGAKVTVTAVKLDDGSLEARAVQVGRDGLTPM
jgi:hypothetical protein